MFKQKPTERKKYNVFIWILLAVFALCAGAGGFLSVCGDKISAEAAGSAVSLTPDAASLFLPDSYEQYLTMKNPSDISICDDYLAVSEEKNLYIFDRKTDGSVYRKYSHDQNIAKIQFSTEGQLYFTDVLQRFYKLDPKDEGLATKTEQDSLTNLTTFYIREDILFEAYVTNSVTTYRTVPLSDPKNGGVQFEQNHYTNTPHLTFDNNIFYTVVQQLVNTYSYNTALEKYVPAEHFALGTNMNGVASACAINGILYLSVNGNTNNNNGLYACDLSNSSHVESLLVPGNGFGALTSYGGKLYAVKGNAVMEYSLEGGVQKTNYEISSASDSVGRLSGATDSVRAGNLLVTADAGNHRLSIYDFAKRRSSVLPVTYIPKFVATDGEIIAAAAVDTVYLYERNRVGDFEQTFSNAATTISGLACLYGNCYYVTHSFGYGKIERTDGEFRVTSCTRDSLDEIAPAALTSDLYGNLYVVRSDGSVVRFTEANFTDSAAQGETLACKLPEEFSCVRSDFEGNLYCLNKEKILCKFTQDASEGEELASIDGTDFVYSEEETILPVSYALGFEDDCIYFNFGNFAAVSKEGSLGFPTLKTIDASDVHGELSRVHAPDDVRYADVQKGAVGIQVDLSTLGADASYFPFAAYSRTAEKDRGVVLAEKGNFLLVALYHDRGYDIRLFRKEQCTEVQATIEESAGQKFLSSGCKLYHYPCIADAYEASLERGACVKVLYTVKAGGEDETGLGYDFAYVEAETNGPAREAVKGYVPLSFLTDADPHGGEPSVYEIASLKEEAVFTSAGGEEITLAAGTEVRLYATEEKEAYTARYVDKDGTEYFLTVTESMIYRGESDALRIALIVTLSVLALVIVGAYFALLPRKKKD